MRVHPARELVAVGENSTVAARAPNAASPEPSEAAAATVPALALAVAVAAAARRARASTARRVPGGWPAQGVVLRLTTACPAKWPKWPTDASAGTTSRNDSNAPPSSPPPPPQAPAPSTPGGVPTQRRAWS